MKRVIFAAVAALVAAPLLAWHPPKMGVKENPSPKDGKRTWPEVVAAFKATLPKCGEAWELDKKGYVCFNDMGVLDFNGTLTADEEITQLAVSRTRPAGSLHLLTANNPIFLITGNCP